MSENTATAVESEAVTIRQALADDAWEGHDETLTAADLDDITAIIAKTAAAITVEQIAIHVPAQSDAWRSGWRAALNHVAHALVTKSDLIRTALDADAWEGHDETLTAADLDAITKVAALSSGTIANQQYDAFLSSPTLDTDWIEGWHAAVLHTTSVLSQQGLTAN